MEVSSYGMISNQALAPASKEMHPKLSGHAVAFVGHANGDTFVKKSHSEKLHEKYAGDKNIIT